MAGNDLFSVAVLGDRNLLRNLSQLPDVVQEILYRKIEGWTDDMADQIVDNIRSRFKVKSGKLIDAVQAVISEEGGTIKGFVTIDAPYARIQDTGGHTAAHIIRPKTARVLRFMWNGKKAFARFVNHPGSVIPGTRYVKDAYLATSKIVGRDAKKAIVEGIRQHMRSGQ